MSWAKHLWHRAGLKTEEMGLGRSSALCHVLGSELHRILPYRDALAEGKQGKIWLCGPSQQQGSAQKEQGVRGAGHSRAFASLPALPAISVLLLMFTRQVWHHRDLSKDQIPPQLSPGAFFLLAGQGRRTVTERKNSAPRCLRNTTGPAVPPAISRSASPLVGAGTPGRAPGTLPASPLTGSSCQAAGGAEGGRYF